MGTKKITVTSTWRSTQTFEVPADADLSGVGELGNLLDLIKRDPDGDGDITCDLAELIDWDVR